MMGSIRLRLFACFVLLQAVWVQASELELEIFVAEPDEINVTSALIMGPTEMMVVCGQATKSSANRLADLIESKNKPLKYVFLTHAHLDHSQGASVLLKRFPDAEFISTPAISKRQNHRMSADDSFAFDRYGDNAAIPSVPANAYSESEILIDGASVEIWSDIYGDVGIAPVDEPHVALYIPSLNALMPSDVVYFNGHVMVGGSTHEHRLNWIRQLEGWMERDFDVVVPGHMPKTSLGDLTPMGALTHTRDYLLAWDEVVAKSANADEAIEQMLARFPDAQHQSALRLSSYMDFKELHRLSFNPTVRKVTAYMPEWMLDWFNEWAYNSRMESYNLSDTDAVAH